ncbi:MAG: carbon-nitrogen hydrolase [Bacteroidetes bacterium]|jgi:predicted amidohydrolase|nr:carbon-nitrogen hydrolase [Bacteroidota bacterium]
MRISVATCYFPVDADISRNQRYVETQMREARSLGADVAHFPEASLSGYAGVDFKSYYHFDWSRLQAATRHVLNLARQTRLWVILGSTHRLTGRHKPHDSAYVINPQGQIIDRYDKMFCSKADLVYYSPGRHFATFDLKGVRCGVLLCYEYAFPELYREYKRRGAQLVFHSFHAGHASPKRVAIMATEVGARYHALNRGSSYPEVRMPASVQAAATANYVWVSCSNTSARHSCFPSFFVRADGIITGRLRRHVAGVLISTVDTNKRFYDGTRDWRDRAMRGIFHSGKLVRDRRSNARTQL